MSLWDTTSKRPPADMAGSKRNIIATKLGWVRRIAYKDVHNNVRIKDEPLVAVGGLDVKTGTPKISELYVANTTGGSTLKAGVQNIVYVVFTEPLSIAASPVALTLPLANTAGGAAVSATSDTAKANIVNANNTVAFKFTATAGTYRVAAQTIASAAGSKIYSVNGGTSESIDGVISTAVANALPPFKVV